MISRRQFFVRMAGGLVAVTVAPLVRMAPAPELLTYGWMPMGFDRYVYGGINRSKFKFWSTDLGALNAYHQCLPVCNTGELLAQGWERGIARHAHEDPFMVKMK